MLYRLKPRNHRSPAAILARQQTIIVPTTISTTISVKQSYSEPHGKAKTHSESFSDSADEDGTEKIPTATHYSLDEVCSGREAKEHDKEDADPCVDVGIV